MTIAAFERCLGDVLDKWDTSLEKQVIISAVADGVPIYGLNQIKHWKDKAADFPSDLAVKIVQENLWFGP